MLKIRLQRVGRKHEPLFRLVLTDSKNAAKSGKSLETLGNYDSRRGEEAIFKADRITYWVSKGAQVSDTVHNLLINKKIISGKKINVLPKKTPIVKEGAVEDTSAGSSVEAEATVSESNADESSAPTPTVGEAAADEPVSDNTAPSVDETVV